jgi:hypothetical protein
MLIRAFPKSKKKRYVPRILRGVPADEAADAAVRGGSGWIWLRRPRRPRRGLQTVQAILNAEIAPPERRANRK